MVKYTHAIRRCRNGTLARKWVDSHIAPGVKAKYYEVTKIQGKMTCFKWFLSQL